MLAAEKGFSSWLTILPVSEHGLPYTKAPFEILFVSNMACDHHYYLHDVFVAINSLLSMPLDVPVEVYQQFFIMN